MCSIAPAIGALIAARAIQGAGAAGVIVLTRAIVRDLYEGPRAGRELSLMGAIMGVAPIVAPMIGGFTQTQFGWRFGFIVILLAGIAAIAVVARLLPETARQSKPAGHPVVALVRSFAIVGRNGGFLAHLGIATASYAGLFAYISGSSFVLQGQYGLSPLAFGLFYGMISLGFIAGTLTGAKLVTRHGFNRSLGVGSAALAGGGLLLIAAVGFAPSHTAALAVPMMVFLAGVGLVLPLSMASRSAAFPRTRRRCVLIHGQRPANRRRDRRRNRRPRPRSERLADGHRHRRLRLSHPAALALDPQNQDAPAQASRMKRQWRDHSRSSNQPSTPASCRGERAAAEGAADGIAAGGIGADGIGAGRRVGRRWRSGRRIG